MRQEGRLRGVAARARRARDAARPARADAPRRRAAWLVALVLAMMVCPAVARAEVIKSNILVTPGWVDYLAFPYDNKQQAAIATLGWDWSSLSSHRQSQISSNAAFNAYANQFLNGADDLAGFLGKFGPFRWILEQFGGDKLWWVTTEQQFYDNAYNAVQAILTGEEVNIDTGEGPYPGTGLPKVVSFTSKCANKNVTNNAAIPAASTLRINDSVANMYKNVNRDKYKYRTIALWLSSGSGKFGKTLFLFYTANKPEIYQDSQGRVAFKVDGAVQMASTNQYTTWTINSIQPNYETVQGMISIDLSLTNDQIIGSTYEDGLSRTLTQNVWKDLVLYWTSPNTVSSGPDVPDPPVTKPTQPEPDTPVAPSPPQLPDPIETPVPDPPEPIVTPTYNPDPTGTNQDYTPWLDEIIRLLRMINTSIVTLTNEMIGAVNTAYDAVVDAIYSHQMEMRQLVTWLNTQLQEGMDGVIEQLNDYLYHTMGWFEDDLQIMLDDIKDDIIQQLKLIRMKIGQKGGTSEPVSGPDDPNWWDWLTRMFSEWLSDLFDIGEDKKDVLDKAFDALKECFPFSIPWDLVTILGLLAHDPVVPVADLPLPVPEVVDASGMIEVHIDLTPYEGVATVIRAMTLIGFAVGLAKMSYEWFSTIKVGDM